MASQTFWPAIAVAQVFGIPPAALTEAVASLTPGKMRGERRLWNGITILNDSYNSNPEAARHMMDVLQNESAVRRIAVLGEMRELGSMSERLHRDLGAYAAAVQVSTCSSAFTEPPGLWWKRL